MLETAQPIDTQTVRVHPDDNVAIAVTDLPPGSLVSVGKYRTNAWIPAGHKLALSPIRAGDPIIKHGDVIGEARIDIASGEHVHTRNTGSVRRINRARPLCSLAERTSPPLQDGGFMGYPRSSGRVGTRNEVWVIGIGSQTSAWVGQIAQYAHPEAIRQVDGIFGFTFADPCLTGLDSEGNCFELLLNLIQNPNAGGVLLISEAGRHTLAQRLLDALPAEIQRIVRHLATSSFDDDKIVTGIEYVMELAVQASFSERTECASSDLVIGLKCGGSGALIGVSGNRLLGSVTDRIAAHRGSVILSELSEFFGSEHLLINRAGSEQASIEVRRLLERFKAIRLSHTARASEFPSPGELDGGLTTFEEKSLAAVQKAGRSSINHAVSYGQQVPTHAGLSLLSAPGDDEICTTALAAAGANLILFATGQATPVGSVVPMLQVSASSDLAVCEPKWIDFDGGTVFSTTAPSMVEDALFDLVQKTASGRPSRNEIFGARSVKLWSRGRD